MGILDHIRRHTHASFVEKSEIVPEKKSVTIGDAVTLGGAEQRQETNWTAKSAYADGILASTWVYIAIRKIATAASSVPWMTERRVGDDEWEPVSGQNELTDLINSPNIHWSRQDLIERMIWHLYMTGNALITKIEANGRTKELWLIDIDKLKPVTNARGMLSHYELVKDNTKVDANHVIQVMFANPDPDMPWVGMSPMQAAAATINSDRSARDWQEQSFQNRAVPSGIISHGGTLSQEQYESAIARIDERMTGSSNARKIMLLGADARWNPVSLSPADMDFLNSRKMSREEILAVFGVPHPVVGIYDDATLANIQTARRIFWEETVVPDLDNIRDALNRGLVPEFGSDLRLNYDLSKVPAMRAMILESVKSAQMLWQMGIPVNDISRRLGLGFDSVRGGDNGFVNAATVSVEEAASGSGDINNPDPTEV